MFGILNRKISAKQWEEAIEQKKLKKNTPSKFLFKRYTCGLCKSGIRFQFVWRYTHESEWGYGHTTYIYSYICKRCAPTREQLLFMSISFNNNMPKYKYSSWNM